MLSFVPAPATTVVLLGKAGNAEACGFPRFSKHGCEMMMGGLKGRLCSPRSLCAITAASGHLLSCLPGDCRCPWQQPLSQSTSAWRSLKLPVEPSWGCPGVGRTR